jgi:hypothetical protein
MSAANNQNRYEGCGKVGPLRSIFFAEFHPTAGPMIRCQAPANGRDIVTKEIFESISVYIIPKPQLARTPMTVNALDRKICGYPIILKDEKYKRNQFMFNVCFVCYPWSRTIQYEPALIKLSRFLVDLELEDGFLSSEEKNDRGQLEALLEQIFQDINERGECVVEVRGRHTLQLKVTSNAPDPKPVHDWDVPVMMVDVSVNNENSLDGEEWDLTTQQLLPFIDGINHVARIAAEADVETNLVKAAIQNLLYHRVVEIVPIFMYGNVYCVTPRLNELREDNVLRNEFMQIIQREPPPPSALEEAAVPAAQAVPRPVVTFRDVFAMVCEFNNHTTVTDICNRFQPRDQLNVDECKLVQFLVLKGILRRVHKFPVYVKDSDNHAGSLGTNNVGGIRGAASEFYPYFTGQKTLDEICCRTGLAAKKLEDVIDNDPNVYVLRQ